MAEEFLKEYGDSYMVAAQEGRNIIRELKLACLLEDDPDGFDDHFKIHDVVRNMTL